MNDLEKRVERMIAKNLDFRLLVYLYMYHFPEATKASLAARLGITPITMSRAIASGKKGVDEALVPGVKELMKELDQSEVWAGITNINETNRLRGKADREQKIKDIICEHLGCSQDSWQYNSGPLNLDYILITDHGKRYFSEKIGDRSNIRVTMPRTLNAIARIPGEEEVTLVCYSEAALQELMSERIIREIEAAKLTHPITVMLMDLEGNKVNAEYILYDPQKQSYSVFEMEDDSEIKG